MEVFYRISGGKLGIFSTALIADTTPRALTRHSRDRGEDVLVESSSASTTRSTAMLSQTIALSVVVSAALSSRG